MFAPFLRMLRFYVVWVMTGDCQTPTPSRVMQILVANELLKHKLQFVQTDGQRMKQLEMERERREQEERKDWSERVQEDVLLGTPPPPRGG